MTKIEKKLKISYGFELEGLFENSLLDKVYELHFKNKHISMSGDGSVDFEGWEYAKLHSPSNDQEIKVGIFNSKDELLDCLAMFRNGRNYLHNDSCGLHLHIRIGNNLIRSQFCDYQFINKMRRFLVRESCDCLKQRIRNDYCKGYPMNNFDNFYRYWGGQDKYRIIRNHPQGTFEFRIFSACRHKEENVKKFLQFFLANVMRLPKRKEAILELEKPIAEETIRLDYKVETEQPRTGCFSIDEMARILHREER